MLPDGSFTELTGVVNARGLDAALVNGAMQPTLRLNVGPGA